MNAEPVKRWIVALRSGEYKQSMGALSKLNPDGSQSHCCLGVACIIFEDELGLVRTDAPNNCVAYNSKYGNLPAVVAKFLDITESGEYENLTKYGTLTGLNDRGVSFFVIADLLEKGLKNDGVFLKHIS